MKHAKKLMAALFAVVMLIAMTACSPQMTLEQKMQKALDNMNGMKTVSYTHLDVYKRQELYCCSRIRRSP